MKNEDIRVRMFRMPGTYVPYIRVLYLDKHAQKKRGLMVLDSCSQDCILYSTVANECNLTKLDDEITYIHTSSHEVTEAVDVQFSFVAGSCQFHEKFLLPKDSCSAFVDDVPVIGILGCKFLQENRLVIDNSDGFLHTSVVNPSNLSISDCDYFFPMKIGLKYYKLPAVGINQKGKEVVMLADTGATNNTIASPTLKDNGFEYKFLAEKDTIYGLTGNVDVAMVGFNLLNVKSDGLEEVYHHDHFMVTPYYIMSSEQVGRNEEGEQIPPVDGLIGSEFMAKQGWVLDFGAKIIYKLREPLKEAV